ncbi:hypothetical protein CFC21_110868 [Triticum aestivum]|uniref:SKP1 component POZ domain-containing protein n=2 Tax=Triticum aestivum TaxID=4565 RepID=A0A3B6TQG7_WHEAT|nr:hypothetical protein CFC21_110868 [Triticum aestivum]
MATSNAGEKKMIMLKSSDGKEFEVEEVVAMESQTNRHMIEDDCTDKAIPIPNINSEILSKVIEYCNKHVLAKAGNVATRSPGAAASNTAAPAALAEDLKIWDAKFIKVNHATLFDLIQVLYPLIRPFPFSRSTFFHVPLLALGSRLGLRVLLIFILDWTDSSYNHQGRFNSIRMD